MEQFVSDVKFLAIPLLTGLCAQLLKFAWQSRKGHIDWNALNFYGGMPSTHTAIMTALVTEVAWHDGITSTTFAIAGIMAILVVRDAIGLRRYVGTHSRALNLLVKDLPHDERKHFQHYRERLGHTPLEATAGAVVGLLVGSLLYLLMP